MALPIKPKDTQEGCNPISSNCVIWQGPDIPCIKLCTGDSVSDTVAKLAEELCTITDQLNISVLDISCFGAIAPEPGTFADVIQLLINKTCTVETVLENNGFDLNPNTSTCPDDCLVSVATCLQPTDALGNLITELPLRDYVVLIGTRICTIVSQINAIDSSITNIETRITVIEQGVADIENNIGILPTITSVGCVGRNVEKSIETFLLDFESSYCSYTQFIGDGAKVTSALNGQCTGLEGLPQLADPRATMANIPGWVPGAQYTTLADAVSNLWRTVCDMREALITLQASNAACCGLNCSSIEFSFTASGVRASKFIDIYFTGDVPDGFTSVGGPSSLITVIDAFGNIGLYTVPDIVNNVNTGEVYTADVSAGVSAASSGSVWYGIGANLQVEDSTGALTCNNNNQYTFYNQNWCQDRNFQLVGLNTTPNVEGVLTLYWAAATTPSLTTYNITLYQYLDAGINANLPTVVHTATVTSNGGPEVYNFPFFWSVDIRVSATIVSQQSSVQYGLKEISCNTDIIRIPSA
jgi:hypothetical protein